MFDDLSTDMPWVILLLQDQPFAISSNYVREMVAMPKIVSVPQMPSHIRGVINLRGQVVPVVDMRLKLGLPAGAETEDTCIIVVDVHVDGETITVGALADAVREVMDIRSDQIEPPPRLGTRLNTEFINGMGKVDEQFMILLNIDRIFNSEELAWVQDATEPDKVANED